MTTIKKGIKVKILAGKDKKKEGEVIEIDRKFNRAKIKGINIVKKHIKTTHNRKKYIPIVKRDRKSTRLNSSH